MKKTALTQLASFCILDHPECKRNVLIICCFDRRSGWTEGGKEMPKHKQLFVAIGRADGQRGEGDAET